MLKRLHSHTIHGLFWLLLLLAIVASGARFAMSNLNALKPNIEIQLANYLGTQVKIDHLSGTFKGISPELVLHDMQVQAADNVNTAIHLQEVHLGLSIFSAIRHSLLKALKVTLIGVKLEIKRLATGGIAITGLPSDGGQQPTWLMQGKQYELIDSDIVWVDEKRHSRPIALKNVHIIIHNQQQHKIFISMDLPEDLGESLRLTMNFTGSMFQPSTVNARLFVEGKNINLAKVITGDLPFDFAFTQGRGDFSLWSTWQAAEMTQMSGRVQMADASISSRPKQAVPIKQLSLQFKLQHQAQQWLLAIQNMALNSHDTPLDITQIAVALTHNPAGELTRIALNCPQLDLERLRKIATLNKLLPTSWQKSLQQLALQGEIKDLLFLADIPQQSFAINGVFNQLHYHAMDGIPGMDGVNLQIKGNEQQGNILIQAQPFHLDAPGQFRKPLSIKSVLGTLHWQQTADAWLLSSPMLTLQTADIKTKTKFHLNLPKNEQSPYLNLHTHFYDTHDVAKIPPYLPVALLNDEALVNWLDHAFLAGKVEQGNVVFRGTLADYPFRASEGVMEVLFAAEDVHLHYAPDWPNLENLNAEIRFFSESLAVHISNAVTYDAAIEQASLHIHSFSKSKYLKIKGNIQGELTQAQQFLAHSPLQTQVQAVTNLCDMQGAFTAQLDLQLPLTDLPPKTILKAQTEAATLNIKSADIHISDINASVHFSEQGIFSESISAQAFGAPITAKIDSDTLNTGIFISGLADIQVLQKQYPHSVWDYLSGSSPYQVLVNIPASADSSPHIQLISDLVGIGIDFPPFSKTAAEQQTLALSSSIGASGAESLSVSYINLTTPANSIAIDLQRLHSYWQGQFTSPLANGSLMLPTEFNKNTQLSLTFDTLDVSTWQQLSFKDKPNSQALALNDFPRMSIKSNALYWRDVNLGALNIQTQAAHDGLFIKQFQITSATEQLEFSGQWKQQTAQTETRLEGQLLSQNFGYLLQNLAISNNLVDGTAKLQFALHWPAAPYQFSKSLLSGSVNAYLNNGRILGVDPGIGRILGALDVSKLGKRLRFDFSDITEAGLSYSKISADLSLKQGLVNSHKTYIDAMPAQIFITGSTDLSTEQVDLQATVLPKVPIAGTIIGNAANAVTKTFTGDEHAGGLLLSLLYNIKGTWDDFKVERQFHQANRPPQQ